MSVRGWTMAGLGRMAVMILPVALAAGELGCAPQPSPAPAPGGRQGATTLEMTVWPEGEGRGAERPYSLMCADDAAGEHPDPAAACAVLERVGADAFAPVPPDQMCTQQYGGPMQAHVRGVIAGEPVDARLAYTDGCQIARWDRLATVVPHPRTNRE